MYLHTLSLNPSFLNVFILRDFTGVEVRCLGVDVRDFLLTSYTGVKLNFLFTFNFSGFMKLEFFFVSCL